MSWNCTSSKRLALGMNINTRIAGGMDVTTFKDKLLNHHPETLVRDYLLSKEICACTVQEYEQFQAEIAKQFEGVVQVAVMGSGNWGFSLNPKKNFRAFGTHSDIDAIVISNIEFEKNWFFLRKYHRENWYQLTTHDRDALKRNGQNIYSGFICPLWIPENGHPFRIRYIRKVHSLKSVLARRKFDIFFFKNENEAIDYYKRGVMIARQHLREG